jgi:hypothetical protein
VRSLAPDGAVEVGRVYVRNGALFMSYRFDCGGTRHQVELPVVNINPARGAVIRTAPYFDSDRQVA